MSDASLPIPVIDFEQLSLDKNDDDIKADDLSNIGSEMRKAFESVGFCYLKNFGANPDVVNGYFEKSLDFFRLPNKEKVNHTKPKDGYCGWISVDSEQLNPDRPNDLKEVFDYTPSGCLSAWPTLEFQQSCQAMYQYCTSLSVRVCDALSVGLGLEKTFFRNAHKSICKDGNITTLRTLYYPPIPDRSSIKPGQIRLGEHSDYGTITFLFQDNIGGLEVEIPGVGYVPAIPIPGTVVVNIGDLMQRWTSDKLLATKHRVLLPDDKLKWKTHRQSVTFFINPDNDYIVKCLDGSNKYEPISSIDYLNYRFSTIY